MARGGKKPTAAPKKSANADKRLATAARNEIAKQQNESSVSSDLQQKCLDIFRDALNPSTDDNPILQEVKGHLYNRDFSTAFGKEEYLRVYASRWSPSRALAYLNVFAGSASSFVPATRQSDCAAASEPLRVVCLGGGAGGELVGLGAWLSTLFEDEATCELRSTHVDLVDIANWTEVVQQLQAALTSPPPISNYASQAKKDANKALVTDTALDAKFHQLDVLSPEVANQNALGGLLEKTDLVTFMFTLNELYSASLPATQALLNRITDLIRKDSHLLVVDSPGSYSTVSLNGAEKKYPMQWLLDHTLLGSKDGAGAETSKWEKIAEDDSHWFRLGKELRYPIALEDMRFQVHLFRRT